MTIIVPSDMHRAARRFVFGLGLLLPAIGCVKAGAPSMSPRAHVVQVEKAAPPAGSRLIGPIEGIDGRGCGAIEKEGTFDGALAALKAEGVRQGADYIEIISETEPHPETDCFDQEYRIRGMGYKLPPANVQPPSEPTTRPVSPPKAATVQEPAAASVASATAAPATDCEPPCSPGYQCEDGACKPLCNPPCGPGQQCQTDRTCRPVRAATP
jgi:hypothetical protein